MKGVRRDFWLTDEQHQALSSYQERTGLAASVVLRHALDAYPPLDPRTSGMRIVGIIAQTLSGDIQLGWIKGG